nr:hypothetical protein U14_03861 [Ipomoea batatas]
MAPSATLLLTTLSSTTRILLPFSRLPRDDGFLRVICRLFIKPVNEFWNDSRNNVGAVGSQLFQNLRELTSALMLLSSMTNALNPRSSETAGSFRCLLLSSKPSSALAKAAVKEKVLPVPGSLKNPISPPISSTKRLLMLSPIPVPPYVRDVELSACINGMKIRPCASRGIPTPASSTVANNLIFSVFSSLSFLKFCQLRHLSTMGNPLNVLKDVFGRS